MSRWREGEWKAGFSVPRGKVNVEWNGIKGKLRRYSLGKGLEEIDATKKIFPRIH